MSERYLLKRARSKAKYLRATQAGSDATADLLEELAEEIERLQAERDAIFRSLVTREGPDNWKIDGSDRRYMSEIEAFAAILRNAGLDELEGEKGAAT